MQQYYQTAAPQLLRYISLQQRSGTVTTGGRVGKGTGQNVGRTLLSIAMRFKSSVGRMNNYIFDINLINAFK
jgi:hypothetical protein